MFIPNLMEARLHKTLKMNEKKKMLWCLDSRLQQEPRN